MESTWRDKVPPGGISGAELLASLDTDELHDYIRSYVDQHGELRRKGEGYGAWCCSRVIGGACGEFQRRGLTIPDWARNYE